jgi:hypothetical protein
MAAIRHARTGRWVQDGQSASTLQTSGDLHLTSIAFLNGVARSNSRTSTAYAAVQMLCRCYISAAAENTTAARECTVNNSYCINSNCSAEVPRNTQFPGCCWVINILADTTRFKRLELSMSFADYDRDLNVYIRPSHTARVITECKDWQALRDGFAIGSEMGSISAHAFVHALWSCTKRYHGCPLMHRMLQCAAMASNALPSSGIRFRVWTGMRPGCPGAVHSVTVGRYAITGDQGSVLERGRFFDL